MLSNGNTTSKVVHLGTLLCIHITPAIFMSTSNKNDMKQQRDMLQLRYAYAICMNCQKLLESTYQSINPDVLESIFTFLTRPLEYIDLWKQSKQLIENNKRNVGVGTKRIFQFSGFANSCGRIAIQEMNFCILIISCWYVLKFIPFFRFYCDLCQSPITFIGFIVPSLTTAAYRAVHEKRPWKRYSLRTQCS